jgi:hypothetical protein
MATETDWIWQHTVNHRQLQAMLRQDEWMAFAFEYEKQLGLNYLRHLFPDYVIQSPTIPPEILTPTDLNRRLRLREEAKEALEELPLPPKPPEPEPEPIEPPMPVLGRQMFQPSGILTSASIGDFSAVTGTLYQGPGGARLFDGIAASADPSVWGQPSGYRSFGTLTQTVGQLRVVIGCWFYFKQIGVNGTTKSPIMLLGKDPLNPSIQLQVSENTLKAMSIYNNATLQVLPFVPSPNEWLYLSIAAVWASGSTRWSARFYYKHPKGNLTQWASWDAVDCYVGSEGFGIALYGMAQLSEYDPANNPSYEGRISACTIHSFANDDFSDVVYPAEVIEPV